MHQSNPEGSPNGYVLATMERRLAPGQQAFVTLDLRSSSGALELCVQFGGGSIDVTFLDDDVHFTLAPASLFANFPLWSCANVSLPAPVAGYFGVRVSNMASPARSVDVRRVFAQSPNRLVRVRELQHTDHIVPGQRACERLLCAALLSDCSVLSQAIPPMRRSPCSSTSRRTARSGTSWTDGAALCTMRWTLSVA